MDQFSEVEEAFFRAGELMSEAPLQLVYDEPPPSSWFRRLFRRPAASHWMPLESPEIVIPAEVVGYYASYELAAYELFENDEYELYAMAA